MACVAGYRPQGTLAGRREGQWRHRGCDDPPFARSDRREDARRRGRHACRTLAGGRRARARPAGAAEHRGVRGAAVRGRRLGAVRVRSRPLGRLAGVDGRSAAGSGHRPLERRLRDADADHVRGLPAGAGGGAQAGTRDDRGGDRGGERDPAARPAADLPGRVRLSGVRAPGGPARPRPVHALRRRSAHRPGVPVRRLALPELAVRSAVHAAELCARAAGAGGRAVGVQGDRRAREPRRGRAGRARGRPSRALPHVGGGVRRPEPGDAGAGGGRSAQRRAAAAGAGGGARADRRRGSRSPPSRRWSRRRRRHRERRRRDTLASARRRRGAGGGRRPEAHRGPGAAVPGALRAERPRARPCGAGRGRGAAGGGAGGSARLRRARVRLPQRDRRAAAAGRDAQRARGDGAARGPDRDA